MDQLVLDALERCGEGTAATLAANIGAHRGEVEASLKRLRVAGRVRNTILGTGRWPARWRLARRRLTQA